MKKRQGAMLSSLTIKNVVLIEALTIAFHPGFCALTGETGAGKSILLDSLGLALGARSESSLVRRGEDEASVTAVFEVPGGHPVFALLQESGLSVEAGEAVILRRTVKADGGSRAFINDQPVSAGLLKQVGGLLVEIHGQFDTQGLLDPKTHRDMLDAYAGTGGAALAEVWRGWRAAEDERAQARAQMDRARADEAYLRAALEDIDALDPQTGEEETLAALREKLMRRGQFLTSLNGAYETLSEAEGLIGTAGRMLERAGEDGQSLLSGLDGVAAELQEVISGLRSASVSLEEDGAEPESIDDRLFALRGQARKHGCAVDALPEKRAELARQLNLIEAQDDRLDDLSRRCETLRKAYVDEAERTGQARRTAAARLDALVAQELPPLKLDKARFVTDVQSLDESAWGPGGAEGVRFLVSTNPGGEPGPLHKIASGGEMARFMLALKVVLAETGTAGSLVFDEVDSGIGGATASAVGERLARLSRSRQILVVTHAPQVAARAAHHWIVLKDGRQDVRTKIIPLSEAHDRREEIARMLSGAEITGEARAAAERLLEAG